jgi:hypothetical protein
MLSPKLSALANILPLARMCEASLHAFPFEGLLRSSVEILLKHTSLCRSKKVKRVIFGIEGPQQRGRGEGHDPHWPWRISLNGSTFLLLA